jgi:hypothetical protein
MISHSSPPAIETPSVRRRRRYRGSRAGRRTPHRHLSALATRDLSLPIEALAQAAASLRDNVDKQVAGSEQVASLVRGLEQQYDELTTGDDSRLLADGARLPTADELAAELERHLSNRPESDDDPSAY